MPDQNKWVENIFEWKVLTIKHQYLSEINKNLVNTVEIEGQLRKVTQVFQGRIEIEYNNPTQSEYNFPILDPIVVVSTSVNKAEGRGWGSYFCDRDGNIKGDENEPYTFNTNILYPKDSDQIDYYWLLIWEGPTENPPDSEKEFGVSIVLMPSYRELKPGDQQADYGAPEETVKAKDLPLDSDECMVCANQTWQETQVTLKPKEKISICYKSGQWTANTDSGFYEAKEVENNIAKDGYTLSGSYEGSLVAKVRVNGQEILIDNQYDLTELEGKLYLKIYDEWDGNRGRDLKKV